MLPGINTSLPFEIGEKQVNTLLSVALNPLIVVLPSILPVITAVSNPCLFFTKALTCSYRYSAVSEKAEKMRIEAEAQANANKELADSISDALIDYQKIEKWDGKLPKVTDSNAIVSLDSDEEDADATGSENSENSGK